MFLYVRTNIYGEIGVTGDVSWDICIIYHFKYLLPFAFKERFDKFPLIFALVLYKCLSVIYPILYNFFDLD